MSRTALLLLLCLSFLPRPRAEERKPTMSVKKITPVLLVETIEPCVEFWKRLGFAATIEVPEGNRLGFVTLEKGGVEVMYQSYASIRKDDPNRERMTKGPTFLYVEVENLEAVKAAVKDAKVAMAERTTFYGAREIGVLDPGGHVITFAQFGK